MEVFLKVVSSMTALMAAGFWFWSASVPLPDFTDLKTNQPDSPAHYLRRQGKLSAAAAVLAGISAATHAVVLWMDLYG